MHKPRIRVGYADVAPELVQIMLDFVADRFEFELTTDRDAPFVFHSCGGLDVLKYPGVRIFMTGENVTANFAISDYALTFDQLDFGDRCLWLPLARWNVGRYKSLLEPRRDPEQVLAAKTGFCAYVMSNTTNSDDMRVRIFEELNRYKTVSSGGRWRNNIGGRVADKQAFQAAHKFSIAFENCSYPGYLTEKFIDAAAADSIPVYWGDPGIGNYFNPKAFINCHDYDTLDEVVERVREIDADDNLCRQMLVEPWFKDGVEPECLRDEFIAGFLTNIFAQAPQAAYRRNRGRWGIKSEQNLYDMHFRPHVQAFKRLRANWRRVCHKLLPRRKPY